MNAILYFFRDTISGTYYFIYCFVCLLLMFSIIGYLFKQKYAKVEIKLNTSQPKLDEKVKEKQNQVPKSDQIIQKNEVILEKPIQLTSTITSQKPNINIQPQVVVTPNLNTNTQNQTQVVSNQPKQTTIQLQPTIPLKKIEIPDIK